MLTFTGSMYGEFMLISLPDNKDGDGDFMT